MFLKYQLGEDGKRVYTLKSVKDGKVCKSAHPGKPLRFVVCSFAARSARR
jgi:hypothetical protein